MCHVLCVTCHLWHVICYLSPVTWPPLFSFSFSRYESPTRFYYAAAEGLVTECLKTKRKLKVVSSFLTSFQEEPCWQEVPIPLKKNYIEGTNQQTLQIIDWIYLGVHLVREEKVEEKRFIFKCFVSLDTSLVTGRMSYVTCHLSSPPTATATDPSPANSHTTHSGLVPKDRAQTL